LDITSYIRELLFGHDCVIVPGFGGFVCNYMPARIDRASNMFYPPVKQISFNRNLNHNDGLLVGRISESLKISYGDARNHVADFVEGIRKRLSKGEKVVFENIGTFTNNHEGNVQFEPDRDVNYHLDSFGLTAFTAEPLQGYDIRHKILKTGKETSRQIPLRKILWRAAVIIPLLGVLVAVPLTTDILKNKVQTTNLNPLASVEFEASKAESGKPSDEKAAVPLSDIGAGEDDVSQPIAEETTAEAYYLIAGSFKSEANAESLLAMLEQDGYKPELISGPNGFIRVSAMSFTALEDAVQKKDSVGRKYPDAWIAKGK